MVQEGDGNYTSSEPPNANATIARFVVIGGMPPATTRSSRNASSRSSFCVITEHAVHLQRCTRHEASLHARLIITESLIRANAGNLKAAAYCQCAWYPSGGVHGGLHLCICLHTSNSMLLLHIFDNSVLQAMLSALRMRLLRLCASHADIGRQPPADLSPGSPGCSLSAFSGDNNVQGVGACLASLLLTSCHVSTWCHPAVSWLARPRWSSDCTQDIGQLTCNCTVCGLQW